MLQYLTFEDKIRLECVSKQWQRCVYQRQSVFEIDVFKRYNNENSLIGLFRRIDDERQSDEQRVVSVVKKCPNITKDEQSVDQNRGPRKEYFEIMVGMDRGGVPEYGSSGTFFDPRSSSRGSGGPNFGK